MDITVRERIQGATAAQYINSKLASLGIHDIKLMHDDMVKPNGIWVVTQIEGRSGLILLPKSYNETKLKPYILWYCKGDDGRARDPNEEDLISIIKVKQRASDIWAQGEKRADNFDNIDAKKDQKHNQKFKERIHEVAPALKKALKAGNL